MKTKSLLLAPVAGLVLLLSPVRAEDPAPISPDLQEFLTLLSKMAAGANGKDAKEDPQVDVQPLLDALLKLTAAMASAQAGQGNDVPAPKPAPAPAQGQGQAAKTPQTQDLQALLATLAKSLESLAKMASDDPAAPDPAAAATNTSPSETKPAAAPAVKPKPLNTGGLSTGGLEPSSSLNGRGAQAGAPRMSDSEWRQLFPARDDRR
jgi:hypothetical protein